MMTLEEFVERAHERSEWDPYYEVIGEPAEYMRDKGIVGGWQIQACSDVFLYLDKYADSTYALGAWKEGKLVQMGTRTADVEVLMAEFLGWELTGELTNTVA